MTNRCLNLIAKDHDPVVVRPADAIRLACKEMANRRVGAVLVLDGERLVGIVTGRDVVRAIGEGRDTAIPVADVMTPNPEVIACDRTAIDALRMMSDGGYRHLPVVRDGKLVGVVSRGDFQGLELDRLEEETSLWERIC